MDEITFFEGVRKILQAILVIFRSGGCLQYVAIDIGGTNLYRRMQDFPAEKFPQDYAQAIGLFAAGTAETPEPEPFVSSICLLKEIGKYGGLQLFEHGGIAEKLTDMNGKSLFQLFKFLLALSQQVAVFGRVLASA